MSNKGWVLLSIVVVGIAAALYLELECNIGAAGSILILGITALVVVWYADETRQLAVSSCRPELVIYTPQQQAQEKEPKVRKIQRDIAGRRAGEEPEVINLGAGPAFDVSVQIGKKAPRTIARVVPREGIAYDDCLTEAEDSGQTVTVSYKDGARNRYDNYWVYGKTKGKWRVAKPCEIAQPIKSAWMTWWPWCSRQRGRDYNDK